MKLKIFKTLWGLTSTYKQAVAETLKAEMQGIEGPAPNDSQTRTHLKQLLHDNQLEYIAEVTTAGSYVPDRHASLEEHLESLKQKMEYSLELQPLFITCLGGCDAWPEEKSLEFFNRAMDIAESFNVTISFETHRGRSFFNPWVTQRLVEQLPQIKLTCDFSHWCVVCERLIDTEIDIIKAIAGNAHHIHARVGYDQGPQVPNPAAPEYQDALHAHQSWWAIIWQSMMDRNYSIATMTPEFGPDGYLQEAPFTREPVADLWELNCWIANTERTHFDNFISNR